MQRCRWKKISRDGVLSSHEPSLHIHKNKKSVRFVMRSSQNEEQMNHPIEFSSWTSSLADLGGGREGRTPPLGVQILSISCSFRENLACSRPPWRVHAPPSGKSWIRHCSLCQICQVCTHLLNNIWQKLCLTGGINEQILLLLFWCMWGCFYKCGRVSISISNDLLKSFLNFDKHLTKRWQIWQNEVQDEKLD